MTAADTLHLEGRLNAHRRLLVSLFSAIAALPEARALITALARENETVSVHEEDPGVEPDSAFACQQIADDEMRAILVAALARLAAGEERKET